MNAHTHTHKKRRKKKAIHYYFLRGTCLLLKHVKCNSLELNKILDFMQFSERKSIQYFTFFCHTQFVSLTTLLQFGLINGLLSTCSPPDHEDAVDRGMRSSQHAPCSVASALMWRCASDFPAVNSKPGRISRKTFKGCKVAAERGSVGTQMKGI